MLDCHLLIGKVLRAASDSCGAVVRMFDVVLVAEHGVVWHQGEHDHVLGEDDEHQQEDRQQQPAGRRPPGPHLVHRETETADADVGDAGHGAGEKEEDHEGVEDVVQGEHGLGQHQHRVRWVGQRGVGEGVSGEHATRVERLVHVGQHQRQEDQEAEHGEHDPDHHLEGSQEQLTPRHQSLGALV